MKFTSDWPSDYEVELPNEGVSLSLPLTFVAPDLARVDAVPFASETIRYGDVIRVRFADSRKVEFLEVAQPGLWKTHGFSIPPDLVDTEGFMELSRKIAQNGGHLEIVLGGMLFICVPPASDLDPGLEMQRLQGNS